MASQAVGEHRQLLLVVWRIVAIETKWNFAVSLMAHETGHLAMLAWRLLPFAIHGVVAATAGLHLAIRRESNLQGRMHPVMTGHTILHRLFGVVTFVTLRAFRNRAVLVMMTGLATLFTVSAGKLCQFLGRTGVAIGTGLAEPLDSRNNPWRMRIAVTIEAIGLLWPMLLAMAGRAERHQLGIVVSQRVVCVKNFMALLAGKTMFTTRTLQIGKLSDVTLAAFSRR